MGTVSEEAGNNEPEVLVEQRDPILIITINRPKAKNAVNYAVSRGLADAVDRLDDDPGLSVGILTGAGGSFWAGMDLKAFARGPTGQAADRRRRRLCVGGRHRTGAGHGPDRGIEGLGVRHSRG